MLTKWDPGRQQRSHYPNPAHDKPPISTAARATLPPCICASVERAQTKTMATTNNKANRGARFAAFFMRFLESNRVNMEN